MLLHYLVNYFQVFLLVSSTATLVLHVELVDVEIDGLVFGGLYVSLSIQSLIMHICVLLLLLSIDVLEVALRAPLVLLGALGNHLVVNFVFISEWIFFLEFHLLLLNFLCSVV